MKEELSDNEDFGGGGIWDGGDGGREERERGEEEIRGGVGHRRPCANAADREAPIVGDAGSGGLNDILFSLELIDHGNNGEEINNRARVLMSGMRMGYLCSVVKNRPDPSKSDPGLAQHSAFRTGFSKPGQWTWAGLDIDFGLGLFSPAQSDHDPDLIWPSGRAVHLTDFSPASEKYKEYEMYRENR
ncbi:hypothetical protein Droror1_Dr00000960 [Drosera rotundifolia]